ncbi:8048_t:CDS:2 [Entrophospora sp. SA101]|nr:8048_t:CDS:2 [Entrophospora sp. SA101]
MNFPKSVLNRKISFVFNFLNNINSGSSDNKNVLSIPITATIKLMNQWKAHRIESKNINTNTNCCVKTENFLQYYHSTHSTLNLFDYNTINKGLKKYWIDIPSFEQYTVDDVLQVAENLFDRLDDSVKTTSVYNNYILMYSNAIRIDNAYSVYNNMVKENIKPDVYTYLSLIIGCASKLDLDLAFMTIDNSVNSIYNSIRKSLWLKVMVHLLIGVMCGKLMAFNCFIFLPEIDQIMVLGIGSTTFLSLRFGMGAIFKEIMPNFQLNNNKSSTKIDLDLKLNNYRVALMKSQDVRKRMYIYLLRILLYKDHYDEALIVVHQMSSDEVPLDNESFNGTIEWLCSYKKPPKTIIKIIKKFHENGVDPTIKTIETINNYFNEKISDDDMIELQNLIK